MGKNLFFNFRKAEKLWLLVLICLLFYINSVVIKISPGLSWTFFSNSLTNKAPFLEIFVIPYNLYFLFLFLPLFFTWNNIKLYRRCALAISLILLLSNIIYILMPIKIIRPDVQPTNFLTSIVHFIYRLDPPFNTLPSLHVSITVLNLLILSFFKKKLGMIFFIPALLIILSTIFIKQHYFADVMAGIFLGAAVYYFFFTNLATKKPSVSSS
ncbi:phosphatase PAP2 family protein [Candidatus Woesearchaeota archaeon]|nr:phosphatase PAP2 family protein [Candidatus Woesearchaeota archaeon]